MLEHDINGLTKPRLRAVLWLMLGYGLLSAFSYSGILDVVAVWMPRAAQLVAPLFLLLGPPLTLVHGTQHLTAYFVETGIIWGLALASRALYRPAPIASIVLLVITCMTWIVCGIFAVGVAF